MGPVALELHNHLPDRWLSDMEKAEMMLGYLARRGPAAAASADQEQT
jgi:hypothetical protein